MIKLRHFGWFLIIAISFMTSCKSEKATEKEQVLEVNLQGHRGCRGLLPENTIPAFLKAIEIGVTTLEMDVVITKDKKVMVSHEPFMHSDICQQPDGSIISPDEMIDLNIYEMTSDSAQKFICGTFIHPRFLEQRQVKTYKPLLSEVVEAVEKYCNEKDIETPLFNIEIKSSPESDGKFHPAPNKYVEIVNNEIENLNLTHRCTVQAFDDRILKAYNEMETGVKLILLTEKNGAQVGEMLDKLSFKPYGYSPHYSLVDEALVKYCEAHDIELPVWTVNDAEEIQKLLDLGVRNIITDYPEMAKSAISKAGYSVRQPSAMAF